jgi:hypothetical protein
LHGNLYIYFFTFYIQKGEEDMKKKVLASLLCASMVATMFAGCGSSNGNGTEKADKKDGGK